MKDVLKSTVKYWWISLIVGLLAIILGIWSIASPDKTLVALTYVFICVFFISGTIEIIFAVSNRNILKGWGWSLTGGIIDILFGILLLTINPAVIAVVLIYFVGFWILFRSILTISESIELQQYPASGWGWLLALGILSVLFSIFFLMSPLLFQGIFVVALISVALIVYGIFRVYLAIKLKSLYDNIK